MAEKPDKSDGTLLLCGGKRGERSSSSSSPEIPPTKSAKTAELVEVEHADLSSIWIALNKIQRDTDELLKEHRALRNHYEELQKSLEFHINKVESLETENKALKKDIASLKQTVCHADEKIAELNVDLNGVNKDLCTAINQIDDLEQYTRKHNLEIHGIPETHEENIPEKIIKLGKILNVHISNNDIDICHRMATRRTNGDPRPIIVHFKSYRAKNELYRARKLLKSVSLNNYFHNTKAVYINENLTSYRHDLFAKVRKFRKDNQRHSAWTIDGKIFVRKSQSDQVKRIYEVEDLKK